MNPGGISARLLPMALTERDRALLEFERTWWTLDTPKDVVLAERFSLTPEHYHRVLIDLVDRPEALEHEPIVVRRVLRARERRHHNRFDRGAEQAS